MNDLQIAVATALGALLIVVATWLLVMRRDGGRNRAKWLGLEFELSTPGLVVLFIGAGLLIGPAFAPHRSGGWPTLSTGATASGDIGSPGGGTILRQQTVLNGELEPNDNPGAANVVDYGKTVSGQLGPGDPVDLFVFNMPPDKTAENRLIVRFLTSGFYSTSVSVWNNNEEILFKEGAGFSNRTLSQIVEYSPSYLIEIRALSFAPGVSKSDAKISYEITVSH